MPLSAEDVKLWHGRIQLSKEYQQQYGNQPVAGTGNGRWDTFVKALAGDFGSSADLGPEAIDVNITHNTRKTILAPLWLQDPYITFRPTRKRLQIAGAEVDNVRRAEITEAEINYWLRELKVRERVTRPCVLDASATNHGYAYLGVIRKKAELENTDGERTEPIQEIQLKRPFIRRISPKNVLFPPGNTFLEESDWVCILWNKKLQDVKGNKEYKNTDDLKPTKEIQLDGTQKRGSEMDKYLEGDDAKLVEIQQVWDKRNKQLLTFADGHEETLAEEKWDVETEGFPLVDLSFETIPDDQYGTPEMQYAFPQQKELNALRTNMRRRFNRTKGITIGSGSITEEFKEAYQKAQDGDFMNSGIAGDDVDIRKHIYKDTGLPPDPNVHLYEQKIMTDHMQIEGVSAEQRSAGDPNIDSATASANVEKHVQVRGAERADRVRSFYIDIGRKLWMLLQQFPSQKRDRLIAGPVAGQFKELTYTLEELRGEFAVEMDLSTTMAENPQIRETRAMTNYNMFRGDPLVNPERLVLDVVQAQNKPDPEGYLLHLRSPDEEFQLVMQGLPVEAHERDNHEVHIQQHDARRAQLAEALKTVPPGSTAQLKLKVALSGLLMHSNHHGQLVQMIVNKNGGGNGRQAGSPVAENLFRNQVREVGGSETAAELRGQPLSEG